MPISTYLFTLVCSIWLQLVTGGTLLTPGQLPTLAEEGRHLRSSHVLVGTVRRSTSTAVRVKFVLDVSNVQPDRAASDFNILGGEIASSLTLTRSAVSLVSQFAAGTTTWQVAYEVSTTRDVAEKVSSQIKKSLDSPSLSAFIRSKGWRVGFYSYPAMYDEANVPLRITADDRLTAAFVAKVIVPVCAVTAMLIFLILYFHLVEQVVRVLTRHVPPFELFINHDRRLTLRCFLPLSPMDRKSGWRESQIPRRSTLTGSWRS